LGAIAMQPNGPPVTIASPLPNDTITGCSAPAGVTAVIAGTAGSQTVTFTASTAAQYGTTNIACSTAASNTLQAAMDVGDDYYGIGDITTTQTGPGMYHLSISGYGFGDDQGSFYFGGGQTSYTLDSWTNIGIEADVNVPDGVCGSYGIVIDPSEFSDPLLINDFGPQPLEASVPLCPDVANPPTIAMKLEQVGPTVISTDRNYTEDTTIRVTAVDATSGEILTGWTGRVNIMEDGTSIYSQNNGTLPQSVNITAGGTTTFLARSQAGPPADNGTVSVPLTAKIMTPDFPLWGGTDLAIPQWITSGTVIDPKAIPPVYDWLQTRTKDIFAGYPNDPMVQKVFSSTLKYNAAAVTNAAGTPMGGQANPANPNQISINPFWNPYRASLTGIIIPFCGCIDTNALPTIVIHEARHTYQYAQAGLGTVGAIPNNDKDHDSLVEAIDTAPTTIFLDTTTSRTVCNEDTNQLLSMSYQGDTTPDPQPGASYATEMDAWVFSTMHAGGDTTPPGLAITSAHAASFTQGQTGTITLTVTNPAGFSPSSGAVTVTETLPTGLVLTGMASQDPTWVCDANSCTRADPLAGGASYPPITVTVNVVGATNQVTIANVSGGGSFAVSTIDTVTVVPQ